MTFAVSAGEASSKFIENAHESRKWQLALQIVSGMPMTFWPVGILWVAEGGKSGMKLDRREC